MLRLTEAGEPANFRKYGREIFSQIEKSEPQNPLYARVIKPNVVAKVETKPLNLQPVAEAAAKQLSSENFNHLDKQAIEHESRMLG